MKWERAVVTTMCGGPHDNPRFIEVGEPIGVHRIAKIQKYRCVDCVGPAPPDLPAHTENHRTTKPMQDLGKIGQVVTRRKGWHP